MGKRTVEMKIVVELAKDSKETYAVTIEKLGQQVGEYAVDLLKANGYTIKHAKVVTLMHYVRHELTTHLVKPVVRRVAKVN